MSIIKEISIPSHNNIYTESSHSITVKTAIPDNGINSETSLLVISYGYGAKYNAKIFNKLMKNLPDKYNMIVISGTYFGCEFLGLGTVELELNDNFESHIIDNNYVTIFKDESPESFNDMGPMQALDTIYMTLGALNSLNVKPEDLSHTIIFGSSHGGYLAHYANILCPGLFTNLLDISCYIFPYYLNRIRTYTLDSPVVKMNLGWNYFINRFPEYQVDDRLLDLKHLYNYANSSCKSISFHGTQDWMVDYEEKQRLTELIGKNAEFMLFSPKDIDSHLIKNANHGLAMDFVVLFDMILPLIYEDTSVKASLPQGLVSVGDGKLILDYSSGLPVVTHITMKNK